MYKGWVLFITFSLFAWLPVFGTTIDSLVNQAHQYYKQNNYVIAQETYYHALQIAEKENNSAAISSISLSLARCNYLLYDKAAALKWTYNALYAARNAHNDSLLSQANYFLGALYIEAEIIDSAEKYAHTAIDLMLKAKDYAHLSQTYSTLAELYLNTSTDREKIEYMINEAAKYAHLSDNKSMLAFAESKKYNYAFFYKKDYVSALEHINKAIELYLETGNREAILNAYRGKAECLIMLRDTTARMYMLQWFHFKDSVLQAEKAINIAKFETMYNTEAKENENILLQKKNEQNSLIVVILVILVLLSVVVVLWIFNRNRYVKKQQELVFLRNLQQEKERIARDLHDNVGGQLSYIIYSLDGINEVKKEKQIEITESITQSVKSVISSLRETIWAISDSNISVQDFSDKLKVFVKNLFKHGQVKIHFKEEIKKQKELNALLGLNLYRICQEILNNAFKYANAKDINIEIVCVGTQLKITIRDNGVGFDTKQECANKYGLQNIKKRANEFGITVNLSTQLNKGTTYELIV